jgi:hypothetical protein
MPEEIDALGMLARLSVHKGVERFSFPFPDGTGSRA